MGPSKVEYKIVCILIKVWHEKVRFVSDRKNDYYSSRPTSSIEQKNWTDIKMLHVILEQVNFEPYQIKIIRIDMVIV